MTDLIERYLAAVGRELPDKQRTDIVAELRDELLSTIEALEESLGRPLAVAELETLLRDMGNPMLVAARYRTVQHVIGPQVYPFWWAGMKVLGLIAVAAFLAMTALDLLSGASLFQAIPQFVSRLADIMLMLFGVITLGFAAIERLGYAGQLDRWSPARLPEAAVKPAKSRFDALFETVAGIVVLAWWFGLFRFSDLLPGEAGRLSLAPVWRDLFWVVAGYLAFELVANLVALVEPGRARLIHGLQAARYVACAGVMGLLLPAGRWVVVASSPDRTPQEVAGVEGLLNSGAGIGLTFGIPLCLAVAAFELWQMRRRGQATGLAAA